MPDLLTFDQAAAVTGYSPRTLRRRVAAGELPAIGSGRGRRIRRSDLTDYLRNTA